MSHAQCVRVERSEGGGGVIASTLISYSYTLYGVQVLVKCHEQEMIRMPAKHTCRIVDWSICAQKIVQPMAC